MGVSGGLRTADGSSGRPANRTILVRISALSHAAGRCKKGAEAPSKKSSLGHADYLVAGYDYVIDEADPDKI